MLKEGSRREVGGVKKDSGHWRVDFGPSPVAAAADKMSRRKQACPIRSVKPVVSYPVGLTQTAGEEEEEAAEVNGSQAEAQPEDALQRKLEDSLEAAPLVINTDESDHQKHGEESDIEEELKSELSKDSTKVSTTGRLPPSPGADPCATPPPPSLHPPSQCLSSDNEASVLSADQSVSPSFGDPSDPDSAANKHRRGKKIMPVAKTDGKSVWQCPVCQEELDTDHALTVHIRSHNTTQPTQQPNSCTICFKVLSSASSLDRHMLVHSGERPFRCKVCNQAFTTNGNMHRHSRIHDKEELKAAQLAEAAAQNGGRGVSFTSPKGKKRSKNTALAASNPGGTSTTPTTPNTTSTTPSKGNAITPASSAWLHPGTFSQERSPKTSTPISGVELKKLHLGGRPNHLGSPAQPQPRLKEANAGMSVNSFLHRLPAFKDGALLREKLDMEKGGEGDDEEEEEEEVKSKRMRYRNGDADGVLHGMPLITTSAFETGNLFRASLSSSQKSAFTPTNKRIPTFLTPPPIPEVMDLSVKSPPIASPTAAPTTVTIGVGGEDSLDAATGKQQELCQKNKMSTVAKYLESRGQMNHVAWLPKEPVQSLHVRLGVQVDSAEEPANKIRKGEEVFRCSECSLDFDDECQQKVHNLAYHVPASEADQAVAEVLSRQGIPEAIVRTEQNGLCLRDEEGEKDKDGVETNDVTSESALHLEQEKATSESDDIVGFSDMCFMDFTAKKFDLVAKHLCEEHPRKSNSRFHRFECRNCKLCFPTPASLACHVANHRPAHRWSKCQECKLDFVSREQINAHLMKHAADLAFDKAAVTTDQEKSEMPELMSQTDFMAMMGLVPKILDQADVDLNEQVLEGICKEQNNHYFAKIWDAQAERRAAVQVSKDASLPVGSDSRVPVPAATTLPAQAQGKQLHFQSPGPLPSSLPSFLVKSELCSPDSQGNNLPAMSPSPSLLTLNGDSTGSLKCQFCDKVFSNPRTLKSHHRSHLGLSPYKCESCDYASADKSTLIRHMRTHNGQRPYKCRRCDFAFTTKANCERHVKKRHHIYEKEEMEKVVAFEDFSPEKLETFDSNFHSPDTICQYCGVDFKYFRHLKNHMKTHSRCQQKPFTCTRCSTGFSMKANAIRHMQKQHKDVADTDIEHFIIYNEFSYELDDESDNQGAGYDTPSPSSSSTPGITNSQATPPVAHAASYSAGGRRIMPHSEGPLDFSLYYPELAASLVSMFSQPSTGECDQPIDLTVKGRSTSSGSVSSRSQTPVKSCTPVKASGSEFPCTFCTKVLGSREDAQLHMMDIHQFPVHLLSALSDNNNNNSRDIALVPGTGVPAAVLPLLSPQVHLQLLQAQARALTSAGGVPVFSAHPAFSHLQQKLYLQQTQPQGKSQVQSLVSPRVQNPAILASLTSVKKEPALSGSTTPNSLLQTSTNNVNREALVSNESSGDLASVNKILESTANQNIQAFLRPQIAGISSGSDDSGPQTPAADSGDEDSDQSLQRMYISSLNGTITLPVVKTEPADMADPEEHGEDKTAMQEEERNEADDEGEDSEENKTLGQEKQKSKRPVNADSTSPPDSDKPGKSTNSNGQLMKKKRNSYADSPNKLYCPKCPRSFPWISSLNRHMLTHTGQKPFTCSKCSVTFSTKSNRERHLIRKHGVNMLDPASRQTMDRPYKCHLCVFSSFSTEGNLLKHYKERHPRDKPPERYLMKRGDENDPSSELDMHGSTSLDNSTMDGWSEEADDSDIPPTLVPNKAALAAAAENASIQAMKEPLNCSAQSVPQAPVLPAGYGTSSTATTHPSFTSAATSCADLPAHGKNSGPEDEEDSNDGALFSGSAERHINPERDNYNVDKITYCWKCGDQFTSRKLLVRHLKEHNIDLPFKCYLCDASYGSRCECLLHQEKNHASDWSMLKEKNGVDSIEVYSERLDKVVERTCKTGIFNDEGDYGDGMVTVTGEDGQTTESVASDYLQRKVYCSLCSKRFWSLQDLRRHMRSHTGERPFECDKCQKRFTLKHSMMRHRRKHNSNGNADSPTNFSDEEDEGPETGAHINPASGQKSLRQSLVAAAVMRAAKIPISTLSSDPSLGSPQKLATSTTAATTKKIATPANNDEEDDNENDNGDDILHNLLGVESETIDKIFEAKVSAASLLGV